MILDVIVSPASKHFGDLCPFIAKFLMRFEHHLLFFVSPGLLINVGVEMIMPSEMV